MGLFFEATGYIPSLFGAWLEKFDPVILTLRLILDFGFRPISMFFMGKAYKPNLCCHLYTRMMTGQ
jgi:hypothetical protein